MLVTGIGMATPVGWDAMHSCAALRAGVAVLREVNGIVDAAGEPVIAARIPERASSEWADAEIGEIARMACEEALAGGVGGDRSRERGTVTALVGEKWPADGKTSTVEFWREVAAAVGLSGVQVRVIPHGNAAGMAALAEAAARLNSIPEGIELIIGFDSLVQLGALTRLERSGRLKCSRHPRGLTPGEACAALLLRSDRAAQSLRTLCRIVGVATAQEKAPVDSDEPCLGQGLSQAVGAALSAAKWSRDDVATVYCDLNGEAYRAHEWALTLCRTLASPEVTHPADCLGDVGAAFAPLLIGMAATAFQRGYARADKILVFCASDNGLRGCACVSAR